MGISHGNAGDPLLSAADLDGMVYDDIPSRATGDFFRIQLSRPHIYRDGIHYSVFYIETEFLNTAEGFDGQLLLGEQCRVRTGIFLRSGWRCRHLSSLPSRLNIRIFASATSDGQMSTTPSPPTPKCRSER